MAAPFTLGPRPAHATCPGQGQLQHCSPWDLQLFLLLLLAPSGTKTMKHPSYDLAVFPTSDDSWDKSIASQQEHSISHRLLSSCAKRARAEILLVPLGLNHNSARCEGSRSKEKDSIITFQQDGDAQDEDVPRGGTGAGDAEKGPHRVLVVLW